MTLGLFLAWVTFLFPGVLVLLAGAVLFRRKMRALALVLMLAPIVLYGEHFWRQASVVKVCRQYAKMTIDGRVTPFEGVYVKPSGHLTWAEFKDVYKQIPLNHWGPTRTGIKYADIDVARSHFYGPERYRFSVDRLKYFRGHPACSALPTSPWYNNKDYRSAVKALVRRKVCLAIAQVKTNPDVRAEHCKEGEGWKECIYYDVIDKGADIPTMTRQSRELTAGYWPSIVTVKEQTSKLVGPEGRWHATATALSFGPDKDSWLRRVKAWFGGNRTLVWYCTPRPLIQSVLKAAADAEKVAQAGTSTQ